MSDININRIAITAGEPAGIGPDILLQFAQTPSSHERVVFADPDLLGERARKFGLALTLYEFDSESKPKKQAAGELAIVPVALAEKSQPGILSVTNARYVLQTINAAVQACLQGDCMALVTGPIQKSVINDCGIPFTGHTEYLAALTQQDEVVMMLTTRSLRVALATTHLPLSEVSSHITRPRLARIIEILHHAMQTSYNLAQPHIAVCGLNPHAGEAGHLGSEEINIIEPVLKKYKAQGMELSGPWSADTLFTPDRLSGYDVVLSMYHDQGLPVLKHIGFGNAINVTLGLPFVRTSVDHGTALELAGSGKANPNSLYAAFTEACNIVNSQLRMDTLCA